MTKVNFYNEAPDDLLEYAVIIAQYGNQWVYCKHKERSTYECPGGHREPNEAIDETAKRELWEETGAMEYDITSVCVYAVERDGQETYGMLYYAKIYKFGDLPKYEIERIELLDDNPPTLSWTYPDIQPYLLERVAQIKGSRKKQETESRYLQR